MKTTRLIAVIMVTLLVMSGMAMAAGPVKMNQSTQVSAAVQNLNSGTSAAVKMTAYDNIGTKVAQLCKEVYLRGSGNTTTVAFDWIAPNYETGLYWSTKVEAGGTCAASSGSTSDYDSDSDSDDDEDHH